MKFTRLLILTLAIGCLAACGNKRNNEPSNSMRYRNLGETGIQVSEIGIGCGAFDDMDTAQARAFMDVAIDSGVNYIDIYDANPVVRGNIGYALKDRRDKMIIQGHIGSYWNGEKYERTNNVELAQKGFNDLLSLLGTDHIEVGMIHIVDNVEEWDSLVNSPFMEYVRQLKADGKIEHIGLSSHNAAAALKAAQSGLIEVIMFSINPAFDMLAPGANAWDAQSYENAAPGIDPTRVQLYDYCASHHIAITAMKVFGGGGRLLDVNSSQINKEFTPIQCINYALSKPCVATAICGASNIEELLSDLAYLHASEEEKDFSVVLSSEIGSAASGECTYCNHCSPCPAGIDIAKVNKLTDQAKKDGKVSDAVAAEYKSLEHHASECTACGSCERRCPFEVPVRQKMQEAVATFGY